MKNFSDCFMVFIGLTGGNFLYQFFQDNPNYFLATERSYFQLSAILIVLIVINRNILFKRE